MVFVDNQQIGTTPCSVDFTYYGTREIRLVKPGFETLTVNQPIPTPWYQIPPIDFVSENLVPTQIDRPSHGGVQLAAASDRADRSAFGPREPTAARYAAGNRRAGGGRRCAGVADATLIPGTIPPPPGMPPGAVPLGSPLPIPLPPTGAPPRQRSHQLLPPLHRASDTAWSADRQPGPPLAACVA